MNSPNAVITHVHRSIKCDLKLFGMMSIITYKTYAAREKYDEEGSAERLAFEVGGCLYASNPQVLKTWLKKTAKEGDTVLFLGAGDIYYVAQYLLNE